LDTKINYPSIYKHPHEKFSHFFLHFKKNHIPYLFASIFELDDDVGDVKNNSYDDDNDGIF
jgi:hypothetical protein